MVGAGAGPGTGAPERNIRYPATAITTAAPRTTGATGKLFFSAITVWKRWSSAAGAAGGVWGRGMRPESDLIGSNLADSALNTSGLIGSIRTVRSSPFAGGGGETGTGAAWVRPEGETNAAAGAAKAGVATGMR